MLPAGRLSKADGPERPNLRNKSYVRLGEGRGLMFQGGIPQPLLSVCSSFSPNANGNLHTWFPVDFHPVDDTNKWPLISTKDDRLIFQGGSLFHQVHHRYSSTNGAMSIIQHVAPLSASVLAGRTLQPETRGGMSPRVKVCRHTLLIHLRGHHPHTACSLSLLTSLFLWALSSGLKKQTAIWP